MRTVAIVAARLGSKRFPCKTLVGLCDRPMISHVLERAQEIMGVDQVVLAVPKDDVSQLDHLWPHVFGGDEKDVLGRYAEAAEEYKADIIIRVTGDCPLLPSDLVDQSLTQFKKLPIEIPYLAMCQPYSNVADGWDAEIFTIGLLREADQKAGKKEREHVTTWMRSHDLLVGFKTTKDFRELKCSVDTMEDLERVKVIMSHLDDPTDFSHKATWRAWESAGRP